MKGLLYLLLVVIVVSSACLGASSGKSKTQIESKDLVVVNSYDFFPSSSINPGDNLVVRMEIENVGQINTPIEFGDKYGSKVLYDFCKGLYTYMESASVIGASVIDPENVDEKGKSKSLKLTEYNGNNAQINLDVDKSAIVQWTLKAPDKEQLLNLNHQCNFKFKVSYGAAAKTNTFIYFASPLELAQRIYTKDDLKFIGDNIATYGPVFVNFETPAQPIAANGEKSWTFFVNIKNIGSGTADISNLEIKLPDNYAVAEADMGESCKNAFKLDPKKPNTLILKSAVESPSNTDYLKISKQSTSRIPCSLKTPDVSILQPFQFVSTADYKYSLRQEQVVKVGREESI